MSQQYDYPYPPPPPAPNSYGSAGSQSGHIQRTGTAPEQPSATTTALFAGQSQASTPIYGSQPSSGVPHSYSPRTPSALNPQIPGGLLPPSPQAGSGPRTPAMEPYNPRQWNNSRGQVSGSQMVFQQRHSNASLNTTHVTGMEAAMPSPPPPYSPETPERSAITSPMLDSIGFALSPGPAAPAESSARNSPQRTSPAFPPPPPQSSRNRDRSASGQGGQRSFFSLSSLRGKQPVNVELAAHQQANIAAYMPAYLDGRPPAARRAASTGGIQLGAPGSSSTATALAERQSPESTWHQGMPLPGPPPGPPPAPGNRSQSLNRPVGALGLSATTTDRAFEAPRQRRTMAASTLGPVPPTPADWVETDRILPSGEEVYPMMPQSHTQPEMDSRPLRIDTGAYRDGSLSRRPATRDLSAQGIRERRSRSRATQGGSDGDSRPSNLVFSPDGGAIRQRREHARSASGYHGPSPGPSSAPAASQSSSKAPESVLTPPYTPAVGRKHAKVPGSASSDLPSSHVLHTPKEDITTMHAPLSPSRPGSSASAKATSTLDAFAMQAIERHRTFVEKEAAAGSDEERLELFANYLVHESRLRRDRYTAAYNAMAGDIVDLTRDLWRPYSTRSRRAVTPSTSMSSFDPTIPAWTTDSQPASAHSHMPGSASSIGDFTPGTEESGEGFERTESRQWAESFKPSLSPIPSMAVSTVPDDDSRGRSASRWWEAGQSGAGSIGNPDRIEKSRRETKYMGVNPAVLQATTQSNAEPSPGASRQAFMYSQDEYPPEKVGWHEGADLDTPMQTPHRVHEHSISTPGLGPLDVSRLVTLPPPYPRHHPAVNNSHPRLDDMRSEHRFLADQSEIQRIKDAYLDQDFALTREQQEVEKKRRSKLRLDIQSKIADGSMSFANAAKAEADFDLAEAERGKTSARANFDVFETSVSHPLNGILTERLERANKCIRQLCAELESGQGSANANQAQEEGDEHPERLEKLTLLKWLFEAREQLHKDMFDLHAMRSEKYSEVILTPYRISNLQNKIDEATSFFRKDSLERQVTFAKDSLKRVEELQGVMEANVSRGVEDQLSAFWDIAPGLLEVIQQIPQTTEEMAGFQIQIPCQEFEENPSYRDHPMQYLFSLLGHAEKSAYQFIESQVNLLCLLHEVRTATAKSRLRVLEIERRVAVRTVGEEEAIGAEMMQSSKEAEDSLTRDLKDKVGEVEGQWEEALGKWLGECRRSVEVWLEESGGLEEGLDG